MSYSPMDLDSSLDDLIKKRRQKQPKSTPPRKQPTNQTKHPKKQLSRPNIPIQSNKAKVSKPSTPQRTSGINARLSISKPSGPLFTAKNNPKTKLTTTTTTTKTTKADPSQIIITKAISTHHTTPKKKEVKSVLTSGRLGTQPKEDYYTPPKPIEIVDQRFASRVGDFPIRGRSNTVNTRPPLSIKGESGPTTVLITGLDPGTNSEDVEIALEEFGNILHCEVLRDRMGRSFGEAEVEFSSKSAALDCIARLDNQMADGNFLRVILREPKPKQSFAAKQIRSVISSSYPASGKMYADQLAPRYDITRQ
ncbi:hypothetical protein A0J61_07134 [Choanephora cucurbitarum]|uniref:RRM domain-containing protein n=1 Tax=Choanephora cucurbitarum TaxID=101091 RepID=A0A1C7N858_9FUNG|nr:hypothetical protein A0J61_07134 [Choanephora cucurbitarum]